MSALLQDLLRASTINDAFSNGKTTEKDGRDYEEDDEELVGVVRSSHFALSTDCLSENSFRCLGHLHVLARRHLHVPGPHRRPSHHHNALRRYGLHRKATPRTH